MRQAFPICVVMLLSAFAYAEVPLGSLVADDYTSTKHKTRKPLRGDWKISDGVAAVTQDDSLYKKYANHGPIMVYEVAHDDASAQVTFRPTGCKTVVFTMDAKAGGHAFRVKLSSKASGVVLTYVKEPGKQKATPVFLDKATLPKIKENEWATLKVRVVGDKATVALGAASVEVQHKMIDQEKKIAKLGFAFGTLQIKQFEMTAAK